MEEQSEKEKQSREYFKNGYNCAQSVLFVFCEECGLDRVSALKLSSSFGGGMGRLREVCGAVSAMFMVAGLKYGYFENNNDEKKTEHYKLIQDLAEKFRKENGSIICRELLGEDKDGYIPSKRTEEYYAARPCENLIASAVKIFEEYEKTRK
mgnify:CR=1 FL=1